MVRVVVFKFEIRVDIGKTSANICIYLYIFFLSSLIVWLNVGFNYDSNPVQSNTLAAHSRETQDPLLAVKQYRYTDRNLCMVSLWHTFMATTTATTRETTPYENSEPN